MVSALQDDTITELTVRSQNKQARGSFSSCPTQHAKLKLVRSGDLVTRNNSRVLAIPLATKGK